MDSFAVLGEALTERLSELKRMNLLRLEDGAKDLFQQDLTGLEASVRALEDQVATLKSCIQKELTAMPKVEALIDASKVQSEHLNAIAANLPARLPRPTSSTSVAGAILANGRPGTVSGSSDAAHAAPSGAASTATASATDDAGKRRNDVPRWYVTQAEFEHVSTYMRGRLVPDKVNVVLDELATYGLNNHKLMIAAKAGGSKLPPAERKRATELLHSVATRDGIKGHYWFLDADYKEGVSIKPGKSGKDMLTLLRHMGRVVEVPRVSIDGVSTTVYVLCEEGNRR